MTAPSVDDRRSDDFRERVRQASDVVGIVGDRVELRAAGPGQFKGLCPFHEEKTPSFFVSAERQAYYCFGCRESGDVFAFLMKTESLDFREALLTLARRAGIPVPARGDDDSQGDVLRQANRRAMQFFQRELRGPDGGKAVDFLRRRGISDETVEDRRLGFASPSWNRLGAALEEQGVPAKALVELGLCREGRGGNRYDFFRERLMIPIFDEQGQVVGFAGRRLDDGEPKYVNSPESPIYRKRTVLYGLDRARSAIREARSAAVFEGYFDCFSAWQSGVGGAVAVCGTALGPEQSRLLLRLCREVVVAFDSDSAGRKATVGAIRALLSVGLSVRVAGFEDGADPDDIARRDGAAALRAVIASAAPFLDFLVDEEVRATGGATVADGRREAARRLAEVIAESPDTLWRADWGREAAMLAGYSPWVFGREVEAARRRMLRSRTRQ